MKLEDLKDDKKIFYLSLVLAVGLLILLACVGAWTVEQDKERDAALSVIVEQADEAEASLQAREHRINQSEQASVQSASGLDAQRPAQDGKVVREFMADVCNWNDTQSYNDTRIRISERYQIPLDNAFFSVFMPEAGGDLIETQNYRLSCSNVVMHVTAINDDVYSYLSEVTLKNTLDANDGAVGYTTVVLTLDVDTAGNMSNINALSTIE